MIRLKLLLTALCLAAAVPIGGCATGAKQIETAEVAVTHVERAVTPDQVRETAPPAPLGPRPDDTGAAADTLAAKLCEYVGYAGKADTLLQHAAGLTPVQRVFEPVCAPAR
ncbi:MAG TPA: hypothetical protein VF680_01465 [Allosphingosinicella sp.]|jgi:hypothetical protein